MKERVVLGFITNNVIRSNQEYASQEEMPKPNGKKENKACKNRRWA